MSKEVIARANQTIKECSLVHLGVIDENGYPVVMVMSVINPNEISEVYVSTTVGSNKTKSIQKSGKASICFSSDIYNITLVGTIETCTDQETKSKCWLDWFIDHYPGGETDPTYCVLRFKTQRYNICYMDDFTMAADTL